MAIPRRYLQYSLRSLLILTALVAIAAAWFGGRLAQARRQKAAVAELRAAGCEVEYDYQVQKLSEPDAPQWQRDWLGDDYVANVTRADMSQELVFRMCNFDPPSTPPPPRATEKTLALLKDLSKLEFLQLNYTNLSHSEFRQLLTCQNLKSLALSSANVTDEDMEVIGELPKLESLNLWGAGLTRRGLSHLRKLQHFRSLSMSETTARGEDFAPLGLVPTLEELHCGFSRSVDDDLLSTIKNLKSLKVLYLYGTNITGAGLKGRQGLFHLKELTADSTPFTDEGLSCLEGMNELECLGLSRTKITDVGMCHIGKLTSLKELWLEETEVTDQGLSHIQSLRNLEKLCLWGYKITDKGLACLAGLTKLKELEAPQGISNDGLRHLVELTELRDLALCDSKIDDEGLVYLKNKKRLAQLSISQINLSDAGIAKLKADHPGLDIRFLPERPKE